MTTSRAVMKGEELCDNYGTSWGGGRCFKERRRALAAEFGFRCDCVACAEEEEHETLRAEEVRYIIEGEEVEHCERQDKKSLDELWKEHKKNQETAWKGGNWRLDLEPTSQ